MAAAFTAVTARSGFAVFGSLSVALLLLHVPREERMMLDEFGSEYAAYVERAGVSWQIVPAALGERLRDPDAETARWVTQAMLQMVKLDIERLRRAYEQG